MGESEWEKMPKLVQRLGEESEGYRINAIQIKEICRELDLEDRVDSLIELNPSLFANRTGRCL